jgi:lysozyme family protein
MSKLNFPNVLKKTLVHEGGYVDHPDDPGGATNYGITHRTLASHRGVRSVSKTHVKNISMEEVEAIYRKHYWIAVRGDELPDGFDLVVFDAAVNSGPKRGIQWFQAGLGVKRDGQLGPHSMGQAMGTVDGVGVIKRACKARMSFLQGLRHWKTFGKGWSRRVIAVEVDAVLMYTRSVDVLIAERKSADKTVKAQTQGAGATAAGGFSTSFADMPDTALYGTVLLCLLMIVPLVLKAKRNRLRSQAYAEKIEEVQHA